MKKLNLPLENTHPRDRIARQTQRVFKNPIHERRKQKQGEDLRRKDRNPEKDGDRENPDDDHKTPSSQKIQKNQMGSLKGNGNYNGEKGYLGFAFSL